jgi:hypothetical protein
MSHVIWEPIKCAVCGRIGQQVLLEAQLVYPADHLPDQPPRVLAHRCSQGLACNGLDRPGCVWAGTLPGYDPFA